MTVSRAATAAETSILDGVRSILRATRVTSRAIERGAGLSLAQVYVLEQLADRPAASLNELAARTATHPSSVSVVVQRLVVQGLVSRTPSPADGRVLNLAITDAGRDRLSRAPSSTQTQLVEALRRLETGRVEQLAALMREWLAAAGLHDAEPPMLGAEE